MKKYCVNFTKTVETIFFTSVEVEAEDEDVALILAKEKLFDPDFDDGNWELDHSDEIGIEAEIELED